MNFTPTDQQIAIDDGVRASADGDQVRIEAFAGTGKTSTLLYLAMNALKNDRSLYLAFNRSIKDEAAAKFPKARGGTGVMCKTGHGLAFGPMKEKFIRDRDPKAGKLELAHAIETHPKIKPLLEVSKGDKRAAAFAVVRTINKFCQSADKQITTDNVPAAYGNSAKDKREKRAIMGRIAQVSQHIWEAICAANSRLPINFDIYLKAYALGDPALPFDTILLDEAQDSNPVILDLVKKQGCRQIYVGDRHQQIYSFRGAENAMDQIEGDAYALTKSFRFGENIAAEANVILQMLRESKELIGASPHPGEVLDMADGEDYDAVLCRGNAGVIEEALEALNRDEQSVGICGGADEPARVLYAVYDLWKLQYEPNGQKPRHQEISLFKDWQEFVDYAEGEDGGAYRYMVRLANEYGSGLKALATRLKYETVKEEDAEFVVSTAHKAKGREWDRVRFCDDWKPLVELDDKNEITFHDEEARLFYVAVTRAQKVLNLDGYAERSRHELKLLNSRRETSDDELQALFS